MKRREPESEEADANATTSTPDPTQTNVVTPTVNPIGNQTTQPTTQLGSPPTQAQQEIKIRRIESPVESTQTSPSANTVISSNPTQTPSVQSTAPRQETNSPLRLPSPSFFLANNTR
jgi:hypothetical protein